MSKQMRKSTVIKTLAFLDQCRVDVKKMGAAWSPNGTETACGVGHGRFGAAVANGFFTKQSDGRYVCNVDTFTTKMALAVCETFNAYLEASRLKRAGKSTPENVDKQPVQTEILHEPTLNRQNVSDEKPVVPIHSEPTTTKLMAMNTRQFVLWLKSSAIVAECKRRGFGIQLSFNSRIDI
jgi:hypothetical protein